jgi:protein-tyrosine kinase
MVEVLKTIKSSVNRQNIQKSSALDKLSQLHTSGADQFGYVSPQYTISRRVSLDRKSLSTHHCIGLLPASPESQYYKVLRTQIEQHMHAKGWNSVMITSVHPGEGKTVTAINLAAMFAREHHRTVLLVDADLTKQAIQHHLGFQNHYGLVDYLVGKCAVKDMIVWPGIKKLTLISGGRTVEESAELLNSPLMQELVLEMKQRYADRYLFFDVPAIMGHADAMAFSAFVDGVVVVVRKGKTPMPDIQKAVGYLPKEKFIGFIVNGEEK